MSKPLPGRGKVRLPAPGMPPSPPAIPLRICWRKTLNRRPDRKRALPGRGMPEARICPACGTRYSPNRPKPWRPRGKGKRAGASSSEAPGEEQGDLVTADIDENDLEGLWTEALSEGGGEEPASEKEEVRSPDAAELIETEAASPEEASGAGDDLDDMWADAFAEQEGGAATAEAGGEPEGAGAAGGDAGGGGDDDIISQGELDALLTGEQAPQEESPPEGEEEAGAPAPDSAVEAPPGEGDGGEEDGEEIEAYIPEDEEEEGDIAAASADEEEEEDAPPAGDGAEEEEEPESEQVKTADLGSRVLAGLVDAGVVGMLVAVFAVGTHLIVGQVAGPIFPNMEALLLVLILDGFVLFLLSLFYSVYFVGARGNTIGQGFLGVSIVDLNNQPVGFMQAVLRYFGSLMGLGYLLIVIDKKGRSLGDRLAGTRVVSHSTA